VKNCFNINSLSFIASLQPGLLCAYYLCCICL